MQTLPCGERTFRRRVGMYVSGGGGVWFWQRLWRLAHIWLKRTSKRLRAIDRGCVFQLLPQQSWTTAALEGKQRSFQLQKWQALWLFMLCSACFVFISVLLLERLLETAGICASGRPRALGRPAEHCPLVHKAQQRPGPQLNRKILIEEKN